MAEAAPKSKDATVPTSADKDAQSPLKTIPQTTGERDFKILRFAVAEAVILTLTAGIAYIARYGKPDYNGIPNVLQKMQHGFEKMLKPVQKTGEVGALFAAAASSAMVTFHGGNLFAPGMKYMQDKKEKIVTYFNKLHGKPGEVEAGKERIKSETKQTWGDVLKGRIAAFGIVSGAFFSADILAGKDKQGVRYFDKFTDKVGRMVAGLTKSGKEISKIPMSQAVPKALTTNRGYRFGQILALDVFATTAAISIWSAVSKISAIVRGRKQHDAQLRREAFAKGKEAEREAEHAAAPAEMPAAGVLDKNGNPHNDVTKQLAAEALLNAQQDSTLAKGKTSFTERTGDRPKDYRALAEKEPAAAALAH